MSSDHDQHGFEDLFRGAHHAPPSRVDLDTVVRHGRRVRRRQQVRGAATVGVTGAVVLGIGAVAATSGGRIGASTLAGPGAGGSPAVATCQASAEATAATSADVISATSSAGVVSGTASAVAVGTPPFASSGAASAEGTSPVPTSSATSSPVPTSSAADGSPVPTSAAAGSLPVPTSSTSTAQPPVPPVPAVGGTQVAVVGGGSAAVAASPSPTPSLPDATGLPTPSGETNVVVAVGSGSVGPADGSADLTPVSPAPSALSAVRLPDPAPAFGPRRGPDSVAMMASSDGATSWSATFLVGQACGKEATVMVGDFPMPATTGIPTFGASPGPITDRPTVSGHQAYVTHDGSQTILYFATSRYTVEVTAQQASVADLVTLAESLENIG